MSTRRPIFGLDIVRFAAALSVLLYHFGYKAFAVVENPIHRAIGGDVKLPPWWAVTWWGWIGVQVFFVISGLVIAYSASGTSSWRFFSSRISRLFPTMLIAASLGALVEYGLYARPLGSTVLLWAKSIVFFPFGPWIAGQIWTLPIEIFFYGAVLLFILRKQVDRLEAFAWALAIASAGYWLLVGLIGFRDLNRAGFAGGSHS